jgi:hypothetical protein
MTPGAAGCAYPSADLEVLLAVMAVVTKAEDLVVGQAADGPIGVVALEQGIQGSPLR